MKTRTIRLLAAALLAPCALLADYEKSFNVKFNGYRGSTTLTDFPVLIRLSKELNDFDYSKCQVANGGDTRFFDVNGTLLASEVDTWVEDGESLVWVKVPSLNATTIITVRYGNASPDAVTASDVWSNGYVGVWHMGAASDSMTQSDSTANPINLRRDRTTSGNDCIDGVQPGVEGRIGAAAEFCKRTDRKGAYYGSDSNDKLDGFDAITMETWTYQETIGTGTKYIIFRRTGQGTTSDTKAYIFNQRENTTLTATYFYAITNVVDGVNLIRTVDIWPTAGSHPEPALNAWNYHALRYDGTVGRRAQTLNDNHFISWTNADRKGRLQTMQGDIFIGNLDDLWSAAAFPGKIDEVRISNGYRSDDWVAASHDTIAREDFASYELPNDWNKYGHKFTVSFTNYTGSTTLTDFPVLVKISEPGISGFHYADCLRPNGADLRFSDAAGNPLDSEVQLWNPSGESLLWVKIPSLDASTKITGYYGWRFAPSADPKAVWSNGYLGVWHLDEDDTVDVQTDSTIHSRNFIRGTYYDAHGETNGWQGVVGKSVKFNGGTSKGQYAVPDSAGHFDGLDAITVEVWTWQDSHEPTESDKQRFILRKYDGGSATAWVLSESGGDATTPANNGRYTFQFYNSNDTYRDIWISQNWTKPARAAWNYSASVWDGGTGIRNSYLNGTRLSSYTADDGYKGQMRHITTSNARLCLGNNWEGGTTQFSGCIDEVRISNVARSADWVKATHDTIANHAVFTTYGVAVDNVQGTVLFFR